MCHQFPSALIHSVFECGVIELLFHLFTVPSALRLRFLGYSGFIFFLLVQQIAEHQCRQCLSCFFSSTPVITVVSQSIFFVSRDQRCHAACVNNWIYLSTCRRSPEPTRAGLWTVWFCSTRWPSGWRMTSPSPLQREYTCTASTSKEPAGTAVAANSSSPSPKSCSRWCRWSGCMPSTMVRFSSIPWHTKATDLFYHHWVHLYS